jgi:hypothetical protein
MPFMDIERFEAVGQRGEACIILLKHSTLPNGQSVASYSLPTGERLRPTAHPGEFQTLDGSRSFKFRQCTQGHGRAAS